MELDHQGSEETKAEDMTTEEANAVVTDAMNAIMAKDTVGLEEAKEYAEYEELAKIHMASLSDWTVQLAYIVSDKRWDHADNALLAANHALQKLAGVCSKLMMPPKQEATSRDEL